MELSIVIPAFEESHKIALDVTAAAEFLREHNLRGEVIVVDDGSTDRTGLRGSALKLTISENMRVKGAPMT